MGILEEINEKLDRLLAAQGGAAAGAAAGTTAKKPTAAEKKAAANADKPSFTAEQLRDKFLDVQAKHGDAATKDLIKELGYDKLAKLIADAPNWQKAWDAADEKLGEEPDEDGDNGGL